PENLEQARSDMEQHFKVRSSVTMSVFRAMMDAVERPPKGATRSRSERRCVSG
ncbi:unnamed protein product, partial [Effrenium voratum]